MKTKNPSLRFDDPRYQKVIGFLAGKGFLYAPKVEPLKAGKIDVHDALWVGENLEPRVMEVLPAAILHFPKAFISKKKIPEDLLNIVSELKRASEAIPDFRGISGETIRTWANKTLSDARVKPCDEKKILRTFRLSRKSILILARESARRGVSNTEVLENLIAQIG